MLRTHDDPFWSKLLNTSYRYRHYTEEPSKPVRRHRTYCEDGAHHLVKATFSIFTFHSSLSLSHLTTQLTVVTGRVLIDNISLCSTFLSSSHSAAGMSNTNDKYLIMYQLHHRDSKHTSGSRESRTAILHHDYSPSTRNYIKCTGLYLTNCWFFWPQFILSCFISIFCLVSFCWFVYKYST